VFVLRNPLDKFVSGKKMFADQMSRGLESLMQGDQLASYYRVHTKSIEYIKYLRKDVPFEVIPFENLRDYIPVSRRTNPTNTSNVDVSEVDMDSEMEQSLELYNYYKEHCPVITPEEWKELTR